MAKLRAKLGNLGIFNKLVTIELNYALNDLAVAIEHNEEIAPNDFAIVNKVEETKEEEVDREYFDLYPTKEELAYHNNLVDIPRPPLLKSTLR